jgi:flagellar biosynthesis protein FlhF
MRLKTFTAADMSHAMQQVRDALGDDAIIVSSRQEGKGEVVVTAASEIADNDADEEYAPWFNALNDKSIISAPAQPVEKQKATLAQGHLHQLVKPAPVVLRSGAYNIPEDIAQQLYTLLLSHGVNDYVIEALLKKLQHAGAPPELTLSAHHNPLEHWVHHLFSRNFTMQPLNIIEDSYRHILIGAPGAGKTMTTAKIAATIVKAGKPVHIITTDNKRAGGVEQLAAITDILGIELHIADSRQTLKLMLSDIALDESVIVDSAGANPYDFYELKELGEFAGLIELDPILVYPAGSDPHEADEVARAFSFLGVEKMIVTRIDAARRFGGMINAAHAAGLQFCNLTGSEKILGSFAPCTAKKLTELYMGYQP